MTNTCQYALVKCTTDSSVDDATKASENAAVTLSNIIEQSE